MQLLSRDTNGDDILEAEELASYLDKKDSRRLTILRNCFQDFNFTSNLWWLIGAVGYVFSYYSTGMASTATDIIGAAGYFLGGGAYVLMKHQIFAQRHGVYIQLFVAVKKLRRMLSSRASGFTLAQIIARDSTLGARSTLRPSVLVEDDEESQVFPPSLTTTRVTWIKARTTKQQWGMPVLKEEADENEDTQDIEDCLSKIISLPSESGNPETRVTEITTLDCSPPLLGSLLLYRLTNGDAEEHTGFMLYPPCCNEEDVGKITADIDATTESARIRIFFPCHRPQLEATDEKTTSGSSEQRSRELIDNNFGPNCMSLVSLEAALPPYLDLSGRRAVMKPRLVYSESKKRSVLHFALVERT